MAYLDKHKRIIDQYKNDEMLPSPIAYNTNKFEKNANEEISHLAYKQSIIAFSKSNCKK